ncbi:synaptobrevin like YKT6 [Microbotryum lychnidis-dioicae p1A1 Lamole]|uniref:Synaptobrevin homolog YKT6 n=1 Tax=Microbotryum lychnidis-dioicae (strain p1A1 Lamole / MvSl-1064) TaxID=683840 RepID=U5H9E9_USTV1|nr:synaptobrevin like YKT6 [Microbotryum lychnidis-dioicae p1A1 Lamole]|eukprot:KDE05749.1 synaptobrevin like YKT6 [Microbotryum lychnidis-dioicae p1A1 Lamole]
MKIISIQILAVEPARSAIPAVPVAAALNLSSFSFYQRSVISQFMDFFSRTVAERTAPGQRQSVEQESASTAYTAHAYTRASDNLAGVIITDQEYPVRVAFSLINKILDEFTTQVKRDVWEAKARESRQAGKQYLVEFPQLQEYCTKYQDPKQADTIMKVQQELDETKIILHKTIESVLERGEKLDSLVDKSAALSASSKNFYKTAQKQNSCCVVM